MAVYKAVRVVDAQTTPLFGDHVHGTFLRVFANGADGHGIRWTANANLAAIGATSNDGALATLNIVLFVHAEDLLLTLAIDLDVMWGTFTRLAAVIWAGRILDATESTLQREMLRTGTMNLVHTNTIGLDLRGGTNTFGLALLRTAIEVVMGRASTVPDVYSINVAKLLAYACIVHLQSVRA